MPTEIDFSKEIIFGSSDAVVSRRISQLEKNEKLKKIAPRIYTTNLLDSPAYIVKRNLLDILAWRFPGAVISHRSANELRPTETGDLFITYTYNRKIIDLPGVRLNIIQGKPALENDVKYGDLSIYSSSESRWMLEVMQISRKKGGESKSFPISFIEQRLENKMKAGGEDKINQFRDETKIVAEQLGLNDEFTKLNAILSALLSTHTSDVLTPDSAKALAAGVPYDTQRAELFTTLYDALKDSSFKVYPDLNQTEESFRLFSFFESYFSNYIEGTKFTVEQAKQIVDTGIPIPKRINDSHDILGTFKILSNRAEMNKVLVTEDDFIDILKKRHATLMVGREDCTPGTFKTIPNRAGQTEFVDPKLVEGTLRFGFRLYNALREPMAKAIFMMFICSEVHPFLDGNGRISRVMMNAELVRGKETRIIVPTVFREDYILALRKLSRHKDSSVFIQVLEKLQRFSYNLFGENFEELNAYLIQCSAFEEPERVRLKIIDRVFEQAARDEPM
ncbi:Fic family protein [Bacteroides ihuae]|uniref:Fic family protein n=1 Tax=Bacteroides ihuae TaxID=1852362 RepID=UPI0008DB163F|nr:Fic family protein [Bacteroides ihuae]